MTLPAGWHSISRGAGPDLLLLHGLGGSVFSWRHNLEPLAAHFRVTALDLKGHGDDPAGLAEDFSLPALGRHVIGFLDAAGIAQAALVGNSLGGGLAVLLAAAHPRRISALVLVAPALFLPRLPWITLPLKFPGLGWLLGALLAGPWIIPPALRLNYADPRILTPEVLDGYSRPLRRLSRRLTLTKLCRQLHLPPPSQLTALLHGLTQPVLVLWGQQDRILPVAHAHRLRECLPQARFHLLPGVGHTPQEEAPEAINKIIIAFFRQISKTYT